MCSDILELCWIRVDGVFQHTTNTVKAVFQELLRWVTSLPLYYYPRDQLEQYLTTEFYFNEEYKKN